MFSCVSPKAGEAGYYNWGTIYRQTKYRYNKGATVFLLDVAPGKVFVMQSWTDHWNKRETDHTVKDLGGQFKNLPADGNSG